MGEADTTIDPAKRMELYAQAQDMLTAGIPVAFMWNNINSFLVQPWVTGYAKTPMDSAWPGQNDPLPIQVDEAAKP